MIPNLLDARGIPLPSPSCLARVAAKDPRLGVKYIEGMLGGYWALTERWRETDPRRARIRSGEIPEHKDFDVKHLFNRDMPMESIAAYVEQNWGHRAVKDPIKEAAQMIERDKKAKADAKAAKMENFDAEQEVKAKELTDHQRRLIANAPHETAHPMVAGFGDANIVGRGKKKPITVVPR